MVTSRPAALIHCVTVSGGKSQAAMGVLLAQELQIVRREIDHQQAAGRRQHARRLADRARAVVEEVQHLMDDDDVEGIRRHREIVDVALAHAAMAQAGALEARARQRSMSSDRSMPSPRSMSGPNISRMRPVPVPRSSSERNGRSASASRIAASTASSATCSLRMRSHCGGVRAEIILRGGGARVRAPRRAGRGRARPSDRSGRAARSARARTRRCAPRSARRKNAQAPSRKRSTRPASTKSLRWREMRGCDWRKIWVRSETVSSASASSTRMRRRVSSPAALRARVEGIESEVGRPLMGFPSHKDSLYR